MGREWQGLADLELSEGTLLVKSHPVKPQKPDKPEKPHNSFIGPTLCGRVWLGFVLKLEFIGC